VQVKEDFLELPEKAHAGCQKMLSRCDVWYALQELSILSFFSFHVYLLPSPKLPGRMILAWVSLFCRAIPNRAMLNRQARLALAQRNLGPSYRWWFA